jgi:hypothetical protein
LKVHRGRERFQHGSAYGGNQKGAPAEDSPGKKMSIYIYGSSKGKRARVTEGTELESEKRRLERRGKR